mgnify:CR=1 FL=1
MNYNYSVLLTAFFTILFNNYTKYSKFSSFDTNSFSLNRSFNIINGELAYYSVFNFSIFDKDYLLLVDSKKNDNAF